MRDECLCAHFFAFRRHVPRMLIDANEVEWAIKGLERVREDREGRLVSWFLVHKAGDEMVRFLKLATTDETESL